MAERQLLPNDELEARVKGLKGWSLQKGKLHKEYTFASFVHAFSFMAGAALLAESMNHHPEWSNVYNKVTIDLVTHDLGGISALDIEFARLLDSLHV